MTAGRIAVGQVFTMRMQYDDGSTVTRYQTDNHVVICETGQAIAWATAVVGEPPLGWTWRYDLTPTIDGTLVRLTYDWTDAPQANVEAYEVPTPTRRACWPHWSGFGPWSPNPDRVRRWRLSPLRRTGTRAGGFAPAVGAKPIR